MKYNIEAINRNLKDRLYPMQQLQQNIIGIVIVAIIAIPNKIRPGIRSLNKIS